MLTSHELAALHHWQHQLARGCLAFADGFPHFAIEEPLSVAEIDTPCDRLNDVDARCDSETA